MKNCEKCGKKFKHEWETWCKECSDKLHKERYLSHDRYIAALKRIKDQIINGSKLKYEDSNVTGDKYTTCSWGLCSMYREQWEKEDIIRKFNSGLVQTKQQDDNQPCPMDSKQEGEVWGCFYRCRIFQNLKNLPSQEETVRLYNITIKAKDNG
jgi:hypothetical protein